jgi:hypothetical protein
MISKPFIVPKLGKFLILTRIDTHIVMCGSSFFAKLE